MAWVPAWQLGHQVATNHTSAGWPRSEEIVRAAPVTVVKLPAGARLPAAGRLAPAEPVVPPVVPAPRPPATTVITAITAASAATAAPATVQRTRRARRR